MGKRLEATVLLIIVTYVYLTSAFSGWVDPATKKAEKTRHSYTDGKIYDLVMSDEFNTPGRSFSDGDDPMWTAIDKSDDDQTSNGRKSLQFYNSSMITTTTNGYLNIATNTEDTKWKGWNPYKKQYETMSRHFKSGMLQSWNKFCYTGGILEVNVKFPGKSDIGGLWPAVWLLGNLGRATFEASTNLVWPWSYKLCDRDLQKAQAISGCDVTSHYSLQKQRGRGATEIDIIEVMPGPSSSLPFVNEKVRRPYNSMTLQIAPGVPSKMRRPQSGTRPEWGFTWYENLTYGENVSVNPFFYGTYLSQTSSNEPVGRSKDESYQCDAISSIMSINSSFWDTFHTFRLEWQPTNYPSGVNATGKPTNGYLHWYIDGEFKFGVESSSLDFMKTEIPNEPSYIIFNTAISTSWGFPNPPWGCNLYDCKDPDGQCGFNPGFCKTLPADFQIDYVRVYQNKKDPRQTLGCNPPDYPTKKFILGHEFRYKLLENERALKPVKQGGGKCTSDDQCGGKTAAGQCIRNKCRCSSGFTGPKCLVPDYKNDFEDWEKEESIQLSKPFFPSSLQFCAGLLLVVGLFAFLYVWRKRRNNEDYKELGTSPSWL